jgi:hypothetical protein
MNLLIAGTARDIEKYWQNTIKSLEIIINSIADYRCVFVESNSSDNTLNCMKEWASTDNRRTILSLGNLKDISRTVRIAKCRNRYLQYFKENNLYDQFDYILVIDLDDVLNIATNFKEQLESCFKISEWDAIASNRKDKYYDIWALRSNSEILNCDYDCLKPIIKYDRNRRIPVVRDYGQFLKNIPCNYGFIECKSAFGGMALYKTLKIKDRVYNGDKTCEHISFHYGLKMYINSEFISG